MSNSISYDYMVERRLQAVNVLKLIILGEIRYNQTIVDYCFEYFDEEMKKHWTQILSGKKEEVSK